MNNPKEKKNGQFDLVTKSKDGYIVYEVKFTNSKIDNKIVKEEISQIAETNLNPINFGLFQNQVLISAMIIIIY